MADVRHSSFANPQPQLASRVDAIFRGFWRLHTRWLDTLIAVGLAATGALGLLLATRPEFPLLDRREPDTIAFVLLAVQTLPLLFRRRAPVQVFVAVLVATALQRLFDHPLTAADTAPFVAFYTIVTRYPPVSGIRALLATAAAVVPLTLAGRISLQEFVLAHFLLIGAWVLGDTIRRRGERIQALEQRAAAQVREQQVRIRQAVADERVRIAQELHDLAAHALGVIAIQAQAGERALSRRPEQTGRSLDAIQDLAGEALVDLRQLLGFLRSGDEMAARRPQPTLEDLDGLADGFRQAGMPVEIVFEGKRRRLSAGLQTSAYRVIQEALTNTLKHAGRATALVAIRYGQHTLEIEVTDTGRGPGHNVEAGQGLTGMRERVAMFDGELSYGAGPHGGFVVFARFSISEANAA